MTVTTLEKKLTVKNDSEGKHREIIEFLYQILFSRKAESEAIIHWSHYLDQGLSYRKLFEALWQSEEFLSKAESNIYFRAPLNKTTLSKNDSLDLIDDEMLKKIFDKLFDDRNLLLQIREIRSLIAEWRYRDFGGYTGIRYYDTTPSSGGIIANAVEHNELTLRSTPGDDRGSIVINPLTSIGWVRANLGTLKVLSVGARNEMEFFSLLSLGFNPKNITVVDLISYSPFIDLGDMHDLKYQDNSFDIILLSHVLPYSNNHSQAVDEIRRVIKPGGIIAYSDTHILEDHYNHDEFAFPIKPEKLKGGCNDVIEYFKPIDNIYFKWDPKPPYLDETIARFVVIFDVIK